MKDERNEITVREFKARVSHYLGLIKNGDYVNVRGVVIGMVTTRDYGKSDKVEGGDYASVTTQEDNTQGEADNGVVTKPSVAELQALADSIGAKGLDDWGEGIDARGCAKCGNRAVWEGYWDEASGEEYDLCDGCIRGAMSPKLYKATIRKLKKI